MRVFISSTVFDLLDVRAEVESHIASMGLTPVLSGSATSAFEVLPDRNSIDTCLVNLESCEAVVLILCQRHGPSLEKAGFENLSATHLEYQHAKAKQIPVYLYARDRLEADYRHWRSLKEEDRTNAKFSWVKSGSNDLRLFEMFHEHQALSRTASTSNWYSSFRDSLELKTLLTRDLGNRAARANLENLIQSDRMPVLQPLCEMKSEGLVKTSDTIQIKSNGKQVSAMLHVRLRNVSSTTAYDVRIELTHDWLLKPLYQETCKALALGEDVLFNIPIERRSS
jgi:Domain of unknown function (DUF4062)